MIHDWLTGGQSDDNQQSTFWRDMVGIVVPWGTAPTNNEQNNESQQMLYLAMIAAILVVGLGIIMHMEGQ